MVQPLLPRIAAGDQRACRDLVDRYRGLVWTIARRYTRGNAEAEDAAQDVFVDLWRSAHRYDPTAASERTFVAMVARRNAGIAQWRIPYAKL